MNKKNIKLKDYLAKHIGETVKIGSLCGHFYCDTITADTPKEIEEIGKKFRKRFHKSWATNTAKAELTDDPKKKARYLKTAEDMWNSYYHFKPILERRVQETYKAISHDEKGVVIIRLNGNEKGSYWTVAEYRNKKYGKKKIS